MGDTLPILLTITDTRAVYIAGLHEIDMFWEFYSYTPTFILFELEVSLSHSQARLRAIYRI